jgi:hypothetical protein
MRFELISGHCPTKLIALLPIYIVKFPALGNEGFFCMNRILKIAQNAVYQ